MPTFSPKNIAISIRIYIYFSKFLLNAPFEFIHENKIKISKLWSFASDVVRLALVLTLFYFSMVVEFPKKIWDPFVLIGFGKRATAAFSMTLWAITLIAKKKVVAEALNKLFEIHSILPIKNKKRVRRLNCVIILQLLLTVASFVINCRVAISTKEQVAYLRYMRKIISAVVELIMVNTETQLLNLVTIVGIFFGLLHEELRELSKTNETNFCVHYDFFTVKDK